MMMRIFLSLLLMVSVVAQGAETTRPNIVMVIVDDLGRQDVGIYGSTYHDTPTIDGLASSGIRFDNAYAAHPRCVPSRVAILSGQYPANFGSPGFPDRSLGKHALPTSATTFAESLQSAGYRTGYIGKWHLGNEDGNPLSQGFNVSIMAGEAGSPPSYFLPYERKDGKSARKFVEYSGGDSGEYLTDRLTDEAIAFIDEEKDGPFLLVLAHYAVHSPIEAPEALTKKYRNKARKLGLKKKWSDDIEVDGSGEVKTQQNHAVYAAMVNSVDQNLARLLSKIDAAGIADNTVVILTSDHGGLSSRGAGNNRQLATTNLPYRHGKGWLYDGGTRVPLVVRWPGHIEPGTVSRQQTTGTDHYASLLEIAGLNAAHQIPKDSFSYVPAFSGDDGKRPPMFWHSALGRPTQTGDTRSSAVIDGDWKLIQWYALDTEAIERVELFNLAEDPGERHSLTSEEPARRKQLEAQLDAWKLSVNARLGEFKKGGR